LDAAIKTELESDTRERLKYKVERIVQSGSGAPAEFQYPGPRSDRPFKTDKLLSGILDREEERLGYNNATNVLRKLHTTAYTAGDMNTAVQFADNMPVPLERDTEGWKRYNAAGAKEYKDLPGRSLPQGPPTVGGILLKSFNPILLRNGYHWKDPGAEAQRHGEFTHRLQWYAIQTAFDAGKLSLTNWPIEVFISMGYPFSAGVNNPPRDPEVYKKKGETGGPYLWMLLCDCFDATQHQYEVGMPWSATFNCPNVLQAYLSGGIIAKELPYLSVLMRARMLKRAGESADKTLDDIQTGAKGVKFGVTSPEDKGGQIWWPKRN
jgi:hypothetical protein